MKSEEDLQQHKPRQNAPFAHYKWRLIFIISQIANRWERKKSEMKHCNGNWRQYVYQSYVYTFFASFSSPKKNCSKKYIPNDVKRKQFNLKLKSSVFLNTLLYVPGILHSHASELVCDWKKNSRANTESRLNEKFSKIPFSSWTLRANCTWKLHAVNHKRADREQQKNIASKKVVVSLLIKKGSKFTVCEWVRHPAATL